MDIGVIVGVMLGLPVLALLPAALLAAFFIRCRRTIVLVAALTWFIYFLYELAMKLRLLCSGDCNIRIDLLVIYPILAGITVTAVSTFLLETYRKGRRP